MQIQKKSVAFLAILSGLSTVFGLAFSVVLAQCYGVSRDVEIYFASSSLFFVIASLTQTGAITEIALPIYHSHVEKYGKAEAVKLYCQILNWMGLAACLVAAGSSLFSYSIIKTFIPGFSSEDQEKARFFFLCISPLFLLEILKSILSTFLNAEKVFGRTEMTNVISQVGNILFIIAFHEKLGAFAAMMGLWFGQVLSFGYSLYLALKSGFRYHFTWFDSRFSIWDLLAKIQNTFAYVVATQFYAVGLNAALSQLPAGQYGVYKYAQLIFSKTQGLLLHPVTTVFFSQFSKEFAQGSKNLGNLIIQSNRITILSSIAIFAIVFGSGMPVFCWIWLNEKFDLSSIQLAYRLLLIHYILLFFTGLGLIYRKVTMTMGWVKGLYLSFTAVNIVYGILMFYWPATWQSIYGLVAVSLSNVIIMSLIPPLLVFWNQRSMFALPPISFRLISIALLFSCLGVIWLGKFALFSLVSVSNLGWFFMVLCCGFFSVLAILVLYKVFKIQEMNQLLNVIRSYASRIL